MRKPRKIKQKKQKKAEIIVLESSYKIDKKNKKPYHAYFLIQETQKDKKFYFLNLRGETFLKMDTLEIKNIKESEIFETSNFILNTKLKKNYNSLEDKIGEIDNFKVIYNNFLNDVELETLECLLYDLFGD